MREPVYYLIFLYTIFGLLRAKHKLLHVEQWSASWRWWNSNSSEWQALELSSDAYRLTMTTGCCTTRGSMNTYDPTHLNSSLASLLSVARFWTFSEYQRLNWVESDRCYENYYDSTRLSPTHLTASWAEMSRVGRMFIAPDPTQFN